MPHTRRPPRLVEDVYHVCTLISLLLHQKAAAMALLSLALSVLRQAQRHRLLLLRETRVIVHAYIVSMLSQTTLLPDKPASCLSLFHYAMSSAGLCVVTHFTTHTSILSLPRCKLHILQVIREIPL